MDDRDLKLKLSQVRRLFYLPLRLEIFSLEMDEFTDIEDCGSKHFGEYQPWSTIFWNDHRPPL